ncbi:hypothetical protein IFE09_11445 [Streptomyces microflavus]|uniref:hypothetical protein n=1 Tax=Streptomyces microflavus TaxID=1919 RepID=UPI00192CA8A4|nr:hypothetical protein [Streptomyces microflavus]QQZ54170.1 hypothetical protein IFE09_11445 [Streptomyces microflavus]WSS36613.1 hypothetical protein OG269_25650 [Streptomyces microflavus]
MTVTLSETEVRTCEACWIKPVTASRAVDDGQRDLLCGDCAEGQAPRRVDLFPPLGIYKLTARRIKMGKHSSGPPKSPPDQGPALPSPPPTPTPGRPPV